MLKWKDKLTSDNILERVTVKRFIDVFKEAIPLAEFNVDIHFKLVEKLVIFEKGLIKVCLLDGTEL